MINAITLKKKRSGAPLMRTDYSKGMIYSFLGTLLLSTNLITAKYVMQGFSVPVFTTLWTLSAAIHCFWLLAVLKMLRRIPLKSRSLLVSVISIGVTTGVAMTLTWEGLSRLDPLFTSFLWRFAPVFMIILGVVFLKEKLTLSETMCFLVMVVGGMVIAMGRWKMNSTGIVLTLLACIVSSVSMLLAKRVVHEVPPLVLVLYRAVIALPVVMIWAFVQGGMVIQATPGQW